MRMKMSIIVVGPARVIAHLPETPQLSDADIERTIELVPSMQPGSSFPGQARGRQWGRIGVVSRVWREGKHICQEVLIDEGVEVEAFPPDIYTRIQLSQEA